MKTTILKASREWAEIIAKDLLERKKSNGKPMFTRVETETGFKITGRTKNGEITVLEHINDNGRMSMNYDERLITIE
jgi:hypothetical protein